MIAKEGYRLLKTMGDSQDVLPFLWPSLLGMTCSFVAGWFALKWLASWLERGHWHWFGYYCLVASGAVLAFGR